MFHTGRPQEAVNCFKRAIELDPLDPMGYSTLGGMAYALIRQGDDAAAIESARRSVQQNPNFAMGWRGLAAALAFVGRTDEARDALQHMMHLDPSYTLKSFSTRAVHVRASFTRLSEGLRLLGVPEG